MSIFYDGSTEGESRPKKRFGPLRNCIIPSCLCAHKRLMFLLTLVSYVGAQPAQLIRSCSQQECIQSHPIANLAQDDGILNIDALPTCTCTLPDGSADMNKKDAQSDVTRGCSNAHFNDVVMGWPVNNPGVQEALRKHDVQTARKRVLNLVDKAYGDYFGPPYHTITDLNNIKHKKDDPITDDKIARNYLTLKYPAEYFHNSEPSDVHTMRLLIKGSIVNRDFSVTAYLLNYDKVRSQKGCRGKSCIVFAIPGHFNSKPLAANAIGWINRGGDTGAFAGRLAAAGYAVLTYDEPTMGPPPSQPSQQWQQGESWRAAMGTVNNQVNPEKSLQPALEDLYIINKYLLTQFDRVDLMGISGGGQRIMHLVQLNALYGATSRHGIQSAYIAGYVEKPEPCKGITDDCDGRFQHTMGMPDLLIAAQERLGLPIALTLNRYDGMDNKFYLHNILLRYFASFKTNIYLGSDDPTGGGPQSKGESGYQHEFDLDDYRKFLVSVRGGERPVSRYNYFLSGPLPECAPTTTTVRMPL